MCAWPSGFLVSCHAVLAKTAQLKACGPVQLHLGLDRRPSAQNVCLAFSKRKVHLPAESCVIGFIYGVHIVCMQHGAACSPLNAAVQSKVGAAKEELGLAAGQDVTIRQIKLTVLAQGLNCSTVAAQATHT